MAHYSLVEYVDGEKSFFAEWFCGLDAAPAARIDRWTTYKERKR